MIKYKQSTNLTNIYANVKQNEVTFSVIDAYTDGTPSYN